MSIQKRKGVSGVFEVFYCLAGCIEEGIFSCHLPFLSIFHHKLQLVQAWTECFGALGQFCLNSSSPLLFNFLSCRWAVCVEWWWPLLKDFAQPERFLSFSFFDSCILKNDLHCDFNNLVGYAYQHTSNIQIRPDTDGTEHPCIRYDVLKHEWIAGSVSTLPDPQNWDDVLIEDITRLCLETVSRLASYRRSSTVPSETLRKLTFPCMMSRSNGMLF